MRETKNAKWEIHILQNMCSDVLNVVFFGVILSIVFPKTVTAMKKHGCLLKNHSIVHPVVGYVKTDWFHHMINVVNPIISLCVWGWFCTTDGFCKRTM